MNGVTAPQTVRILIVDDDQVKRLALRAALSPLGYTLVEADSGIAALRTLMTQRFAVILLDVRMPGMDGFETAALIRERRETELTPIIFITSHAKDEIQTDRYAGGAVDFIFAPVQPEELRAKVSVFAKLFLRGERLASRVRDAEMSSDRFQLLAEVAPIGIFQTDAENRYVYTNPRWTEITGVAHDDALGRHWDLFVDPGDRARLEAELPEGSLGWEELRQRFELRPADAPARIVLVTSKSIPASEGDVTGWIGTLADITAEAGAEAAMADARERQKEARLKSDFLAHMSHEIRTPMNGVIGMTELLLETELDPLQRDYLHTVRDSGDALLRVIDNILDFSKVEAAMFALEHAAFSVRVVAEDVGKLLAPSARDKDLELAVAVEASIPPVVMGDPNRLRQVLVNLVGNAIKFTPAGDVAVRVTVAETAGSESVLRFEISDTGDGIAPDDLAVIFQPFVQADSSTSRRYGGTGLGLSISRQLVALMGGECGVTSRLGEGSTFWFTIRVHAGAEPPPGAAEPAPGTATAPPAAEPGRGRLLVVEDNLINQKVAVAMLSGAGYSVDTVLNGTAAVQAVADSDYDAILMDCQMPEMNGYEATAAIRAQEEGTSRRTPIIALTAGARQEDKERCLAEGMDSHLSKPIRRDALIALVARSVENGRA